MDNNLIEILVYAYCGSIVNNRPKNNRYKIPRKGKNHVTQYSHDAVYEVNDMKWQNKTIKEEERQQKYKLELGLWGEEGGGAEPLFYKHPNT